MAVSVPNYLALVIYLPCGSEAVFHGDCSYKCTKCGATLGTSDEPEICKQEAAKYHMLEDLGGKGWNYLEGKQEDYV